MRCTPRPINLLVRPGPSEPVVALSVSHLSYGLSSRREPLWGMVQPPLSHFRPLSPTVPTAQQNEQVHHSQELHLKKSSKC